jgi:hypothetical protein
MGGGIWLAEEAITGVSSEPRNPSGVDVEQPFDENQHARAK